MFIFFNLVIALLSAFIVFESIISFQQFFVKAPIGKNIEVASDIAYFGKTIDEQEFIYRPGGTFDHANTLGMHLTFWLILIFLIYIKTKEIKYLYIVILGFVALIITLSRSAWLGIFLSLMTTLYIIEKYKKVQIIPILDKKISFFVFLIVAPTLLYLFVLPRAVKSIYTFSEGGGYWRAQQVNAAWEIIKNNPIFGVGTNMLVVEGFQFLPESVFGKDAVDIHNWYLSITANHGLPAIIIFLAFVILSVKNIGKKIFNKKRLILYDDIIKLGFLGAVVNFLVIGLFSSNSGMFYVMVLSGLISNENNKEI